MMKLEQSRADNQRLARVMPGGNTRSATYYAPFPRVIARGAGFRVWDTDGNEYLDFLNNFTATIHGHAHARITDALSRALHEGTAFPAPQRAQGELAERIVQRFASIDSVRFCNSGTEAVMMAVRAARAFTGREEIVKLVGGYHGTWDQVAVGAHEDHDSGVDHDRGIPRSVRTLVHQVQPDDEAALAELFASRGHAIAAVLLEPVLGHIVTPLSTRFLEVARRLSAQHGALLIFDEVVTARLHEGGSQALTGVSADLTTLGKIIGGGLPIGAFGGRRDIMDLFDPRRADAVSHHGTYNGATLGMVAGAVSLDLLPQSEIARIDALGAQLAGGLREALARHGRPGHVTHVGSMLHLHSPAIVDIHGACLDHGLYIAARGQMSISTPMDEHTVDDALVRFSDALEDVSLRSGGQT